MIWTNGKYDVEGEIVNGRLIGVCIKSEYPHVKKKGDDVDWPLYHHPTDKQPQFYRKIYDKLNYLLKITEQNDKRVRNIK